MVVQAVPDRQSTRPLLSREFIDDHRRRRMVDATAEILHEFGRPGLSVTAIGRLSHTSRSTFYELFSGADDCVSFSVGYAEAEVFAGLEDLSGEEAWLSEVEEGISRFYKAVAAHPVTAELFLVHAGATKAGAGHAAFRSGGERFVPLLRQGRVESAALGRRPPPSALTEECLSRAIVDLAARHVRGPKIEALPAEARSMALLVGEYYLGRPAAEASLGSQSAVGPSLIRGLDAKIDR